MLLRVILTVAIGALIVGDPSGNWAVAAQAGGVLALVALTAWYATETRRLVRAQQELPRLTAVETALRDLAKLLAYERYTLSSALKFFPVDASAHPPMLLDMAESLQPLERLQEGLLDLVSLLPRQFAVNSLGAAAQVAEAAGAYRDLYGAMLKETQNALEAGRAWTWSGAKEVHEAGDSDMSWDTVLDGQALRDAERAIDALQSAIDQEFGLTP